MMALLSNSAPGKRNVFVETTAQHLEIEEPTKGGDVCEATVISRLRDTISADMCLCSPNVMPVENLEMKLGQRCSHFCRSCGSPSP